MENTTPALKITLIALFILGAVPLVAEYATATPDNVPGTGFDILLYQPFDFAYIGMAALGVIAVNASAAKREGRSITSAVGISGVAILVWFALTFLAVGQLHLSLGGKL